MAGSTKVLSPRISVGPQTFVGHRVVFYGSLRGQVCLGANVDIGPEAAFLTGSHKLGPATRRAGAGTSDTIAVGDGSWVGARAVLIAPCEIGAGSVVGAGTVVTGSFPENSLILGPRAERVKEIS